MNRRDRLRNFLDNTGLEEVWFGTPAMFRWLTGGSNVVDRRAPVGIAAVRFDGDSLSVLTDSIEGERLAHEQLPSDIPVETVPWYESSLSAAVADRAGPSAGADFDVAGLDRIDPRPLRQPLFEAEIDRYRSLGETVASIVESICRDVRPDDTESNVAASIRAALAARAVDGPVVLVGGSARAKRHRHFTPTTAELGKYAVVSVTAVREGLHVSLTRTVAFDPPPWLENRHECASRIETTALAATRGASMSGGSAGDVFAAIVAAYEGLGWADEWRRHHQGGATGYAGREWIATPDHDAPVVTPMAYAWNPTVEGAKSEDTVVVTDDGFEVLTETGLWPTTTVSTVEISDIDALAGEPSSVTIDRPSILAADRR